MSQFILFGVTLYMFRTVFLSIIRSSRLYIQQQACQTDTAYRLLAGTSWNIISFLLASSRQYLFVIRLLQYVQS